MSPILTYHIVLRQLPDLLTLIDLRKGIHEHGPARTPTHPRIYCLLSPQRIAMIVLWNSLPECRFLVESITTFLDWILANSCGEKNSKYVEKAAGDHGKQASKAVRGCDLPDIVTA